MKNKKYLIVDDFMLDNVLDKIKELDIEKFDYTKILIDTDDKLPEHRGCYFKKYCDINDMRYER